MKAVAEGRKDLTEPQGGDIAVAQDGQAAGQMLHEEDTFQCNKLPLIVAQNYEIFLPAYLGPLTRPLPKIKSLDRHGFGCVKA